MKFALLSLALLLSWGANRVAAQQTDGYYKWEGYGGYLHGENNYSADRDIFDFGPGGVQNVGLCSADGTAIFGPNFQKLFCGRNGFNGVEGSVTYNVSRYVGITGDFTAQRRTATYVDTFGPGHTDTTDVTETKYQLFGGVQIKDNFPETRFKPFAHALAGFARERLSGNTTSTDPTEPPSTFTDQPTSFALKLGGGLDVRLNHRLDLRVIEVDYNPIFARDRTLGGTLPFGVRVLGRRADNVTFGVGLVIH
jgi:hypothetical protein